MKKYIKDFSVIENIALNEKLFLLKVTPADGSCLGEVKPGQFVEIKIDHSADVFLRRPISVHFVDDKQNMLGLLIQKVGKGTKVLSGLKRGDSLNIVYPLGNGFTLSSDPKVENYLLVGGGVGIAPLLQLGKVLNNIGKNVMFLFGARSAKDFVELEEYAKYGTVWLTTEDGSILDNYNCVKGLVTQHPLINKEYDAVRVCGPTPMMKAIAKFMKDKKGICEPSFCEVSLENKMACGIGVCLCCVQDTKDGHKCVCSDGPVFDINDLNW